MVEVAGKGGADLIVVQFLDRFGRHPKEILRRIWSLQEAGVTVEATDEDIREELMLLVKAGIAGRESRRTSERVRANMARAVGRGVHVGRTPYGFRRVLRAEGDKVTTVWEQDPLEAPIVREMYRLSTEENLGYKGIADLLNAIGHRAREGGAFASEGVQRVITIAAAAGVTPIGAWWGADPRGTVASPEATLRGALRGRRQGFKGALCGDWEQVQPLNVGFTPSVEEVEWARTLLVAWQDAEVRGDETATLEGLWIDRPLAEAARAVLTEEALCRARDQKKKQVWLRMKA